MKYKVIYFNTGGTSAVDQAGNFAFYTLNSAVESATAWAAIDATFISYLWDGSTWRVYS